MQRHAKEDIGAKSAEIRKGCNKWGYWSTTLTRLDTLMVSAAAQLFTVGNREDAAALIWMGYRLRAHRI